MMQGVGCGGLTDFGGQHWQKTRCGCRARLTRLNLQGTVTSTMRRAAHPSGCARCGAGAGCSAIKYQSLCRARRPPTPDFPYLKEGECSHRTSYPPTRTTHREEEAGSRPVCTCTYNSNIRGYAQDVPESTPRLVSRSRATSPSSAFPRCAHRWLAEMEG